MQGPVEFQEEFLSRKLWTKQREMCRAVATSRVTSVKGCHGSGKTFCAAGLVPYELFTDDHAIVLTVAPTMRQVRTFWNEIHAAFEAGPWHLPEPTSVGLEISKHNYALGFSSSKGVNAQGFHGKRVLIIEDEAIGIIPDIHDAIEGIRAAGDVRILRMCNPTVPEGAPFEDFTRMRAHTNCITISAFDTPNLAGLTLESLMELPDHELDYAPFPWLTRRRWVKEMFYRWGPTNPRFRSRVLGEFPTQAPDSVFQLAWIEGAGLPYELDDLVPVLKTPGVFIQVGIDVAGPGADETAAVARLGRYVIARDAWPEADPLDKVIRFLGALQQRFKNVPLVVLGDTVGIGYHFMRAIARHRYDVRSFIANAKPLDPVQFKDQKAEAYWALREWMRDGLIRGVEDEDTKAQLSDVRYEENARGQIEIEGKDVARARGSSSPDRAEALVMAFCRLVPKESTTVFNPPGSYVISAV